MNVKHRGKSATEFGRDSSFIKLEILNRITVEYREKYFSDKSIKIAEQRSSGAGEMAQSVRGEIDEYIKWLDL